MDLTALRALAIDIAYATAPGAVSATITPAGELPVTVTGIWGPPVQDQDPYGHDRLARDPRRYMTFRVADVGSLPRGATVLAPLPNGTPRTWTVDNIDHADAEQIRAILAP